MKFEKDSFELLSGVRFGRSLGSPISIVIRNSEWSKWERVMSAEGAPAGNQLTEPRPGHADLAGMLKYGFGDARDVLERASARETAARTAAGALAKIFLEELGIQIISHVVSIGQAAARPDTSPRFEDLERIDASQVRTFDPEAEARMVAEIEAAEEAQDSLGGVFEVLAFGIPPGLGSYVHWDRRLDGKLAQAMMSIQAIKGVEIGSGFEIARLRGSEAHDEIFASEGSYVRKTDRAGGTEGGVSMGGTLRVRAAMKPLSTLRKPLRTVDVRTKTAVNAFKERTDVCAVPAAAVVGEQMMALVLANAVIEKFGGDFLPDIKSSMYAYLDRISRS